MAATCRFAADAMSWRGRSCLPCSRALTLRRGGSRNTLPCSLPCSRALTLRRGGSHNTLPCSVGGICTLQVRRWIIQVRNGLVATVSLALAENLCKEALDAQVVRLRAGRLLDRLARTGTHQVEPAGCACPSRKVHMSALCFGPDSIEHIHLRILRQLDFPCAGPQQTSRRTLSHFQRRDCRSC